MEQQHFTMYGHPIAPEQATGNLKALYSELETLLGGIPPHIQIHATHALEEMKCFTDPMKFTRNHPELPLLWFALMRLYVARRDNYPYCIALNTAMLQAHGITQAQIEAYIEDMTKHHWMRDQRCSSQKRLRVSMILIISPRRILRHSTMPATLIR